MKTTGHTKMKDMSSKELFDQINSHNYHLNFLQENDMCSREEKEIIIGVIKDIYNIITNRSKPTNSVS